MRTTLAMAMTRRLGRAVEPRGVNRRWLSGLALGAAALAVTASVPADVVIDQAVTIEAPDASLQLPTENLRVGSSGAGILSVLNGGKVDGRDILVAFSGISLGEILVDGPGSFLAAHKDGDNDETGLLNIGQRGFGTLTIRNGARVEDNRSYNATYAGSSALITVDGPGTVWKSYSHMYIGATGQATLNVTNGARVESYRGRVGEFAGSVGVANIIGPDSIWDSNAHMSVGRDNTSTGTLNVIDGGTVKASGTDIARGAGSKGTVNVTGSGSLWQTSALNVGYAGQGWMNVSGGARVISGLVEIGYYGGAVGEARISGADSLWTATGLYNDVLGPAVNVGYSGQGTLTVEAGARLESKGGAVGSAGGTGVATVDGPDSVWHNAQSLVIGRQSGSVGTLHITNGGRVEDSTGYIARVAGTVGRVTVGGSGATWANSAGLHIGGSESGSGGDGQLTVSTGGNVHAGSLTIHSSGRLEVCGGAVTASSTSNNGTLVLSAGQATLGALEGAGSVELNGPGELVTDRVRQGSVSLSDGGILRVVQAAGASRVEVLSISTGGVGPDGVFDLGGGRLIVQAGTDSRQAVLAEIGRWIRSARDGGAGGPWTGTGITSSVARSNLYLGLAAALNDAGGDLLFDEFGGLPVDAGSVLVMCTWNGDANLDGVVNADDYFQVDQGYLTQRGGYTAGDFNYDSVVNADDYFLIDSAYLGQGGGLSSGRLLAAAPVIPEPGLLVWAVTLLGLAGRRRPARA